MLQAKWDQEVNESESVVRKTELKTNEIKMEIAQFSEEARMIKAEELELRKKVLCCLSSPLMRFVTICVGGKLGAGEATGEDEDLWQWTAQARSSIIN